MEEHSSRPSGGNFYHSRLQVNLPNSNTILILGILALVFCWWHILSIIGIILSIVTLSLARKELFIFQAQPNNFTLNSLNNVKAERVCAIIGFFAIMPIWGMVE